MEVREYEANTLAQTAARLAKIQRESTTPMLTYEGETVHPSYGRCTLRIFRAVGNDSALKREMTRALLAKHEPSVGAWTGDRFEYWRDGQLLCVRAEWS